MVTAAAEAVVVGCRQWHVKLRYVTYWSSASWSAVELELLLPELSRKRVFVIHVVIERGVEF